MTVTAPAAVTQTAPAAGSRNRYIDTLRAVAIARVVVYHAFGWAWLTYVLPAMGVMFAIAGSLMAASLAKGGARKAVWSRIRRLLPALWTFAAVALPLMFWHGWSTSDPDHPLHKLQLLFWIFPLEDPPGSSWGEPFWEVLWYLRAYLIFVLVSPVLYFLYKKLGWVMVALPIAALAALYLTDFRLPDPIDGIMWDFVTYAACWIAGFAHRDGRLYRMPIALYGVLVAAVGGVGLYWLFTHRTDWGFDLNEVPVARTLWSLAFVLIVLRFRPTMAILDKVKWLSESVRVINARAITIYLWHFPLITVGALVLEHYQVPWATFQYIVWMLVIELALVLVAVLVFGWVEDVSAKRPASLWPRMAPALAGVPAAAGPASSSVNVDFSGGPNPGYSTPPSVDVTGSFTLPTAGSPVAQPSGGAAGSAGVQYSGGGHYSGGVVGVQSPRGAVGSAGTYQSGGGASGVYQSGGGPDHRSGGGSAGVHYSGGAQYSGGGAAGAGYEGTGRADYSGRANPEAGNEPGSAPTRGVARVNPPE